ncbi:mechanosensitive ion channel family protein [Candidatus Magnetomonas plexicatena]|uniref:mechanosensitive ion channel family protein n=1 Tax=Candidatus Magnetomonas plexicatena TaxID=2552947 RepID=UPI001100E6EE|nr:mechanosensitive ion channel [Nitrospirales bacterium LBB_01]
MSVLSYDMLLRSVDSHLIWLKGNIFVLSSLIQILLVAAIIVLVSIFKKPIKSFAKKSTDRFSFAESGYSLVIRNILDHISGIIIALLLLFARHVSVELHHQTKILQLAANIYIACIAISIVSTAIKKKEIAKAVKIVVLILTCLNILGLLAPLMALLDGIGFMFTGTKISVLTLIEGVALTALVFSVGNFIVDSISVKISKTSGLNPTLEVLFLKLSKTLVVIISAAAGLEMAGFSLKSLHYFSGALGIGIGFGLKNIFSNYISGIILLIDKSIKPGDVIEVGDRFGWITDLRARYVSLRTRDGKEYIIPNEELITHRVVSWSHSDNRIRIVLPVGISYDSDVRLAMNLAVDAAKSVQRVLKDPEPVCRFTEFADSSLNLSLRAWISDPQNGIANVKSEINLGILDRFNSNNIKIPYPQRDVHIN